MTMQGRILVIESDASIREFLSLALADEGYDVLTKGNGVEALAALDAFCPDIILLDISLPVQQEQGLLKAYRAALSQYIPLVGLTTSFTHDGQAWAFGLHTVLRKLFDLEVLLHCLKNSMPIKHRALLH
jgi:DNA-binding response OmpR family regulator